MKHVIVIESGLTEADLHEQLCKLIHEADPEAQQVLESTVSDIGAPPVDEVRVMFDASLREWLDIKSQGSLSEQDVTTAIDMAHHESRFGGLDAMQEFESELRKYDLAQIGYIILGSIAEANHGSWDGYEREDLVAMNRALADWLQVFQHWGSSHYSDHEWGFGGSEYWDMFGIRQSHLLSAEPDRVVIPNGQQPGSSRAAIDYLLDSFETPIHCQGRARDQIVELLESHADCQDQTKGRV